MNHRPIAASCLCAILVTACARGADRDPARGDATAAPATIASPPDAEIPLLDASWSALLDAMSAGDQRAIEAVSTAPVAPCQALEELVGDAGPRGVRLREIAAGWRREGLRWGPRRGDSRVGTVGPLRPSMTGICYHLRDGAWRFAGWLPGE